VSDVKKQPDVTGCGADYEHPLHTFAAAGASNGGVCTGRPAETRARPVHECLSDPEATVADGWCNHPGYRHRYGSGPHDTVFPPLGAGDAIGILRPDWTGSASDAAVEGAAREAVDRIAGWQYLRRYAGMSPEWMDRVRDAIARAALSATRP
jgi:hypothetical protein